MSFQSNTSYLGSEHSVMKDASSYIQILGNGKSVTRELLRDKDNSTSRAMKKEKKSFILHLFVGQIHTAQAG